MTRCLSFFFLYQACLNVGVMQKGDLYHQGCLHGFVQFTNSQYLILFNKYIHINISEDKISMSLLKKKKKKKNLSYFDKPALHYPQSTCLKSHTLNVLNKGLIRIHKVYHKKIMTIST